MTHGVPTYTTVFVTIIIGTGFLENIMNIVRNRLKQFTRKNFYRQYMTHLPVLYLVPEVLTEDSGIGVYDLCLARMPFYGVWAV